MSEGQISSKSELVKTITIIVLLILLGIGYLSRYLIVTASMSFTVIMVTMVICIYNYYARRINDYDISAVINVGDKFCANEGWILDNTPSNIEIRRRTANEFYMSIKRINKVLIIDMLTRKVKEWRDGTVDDIAKIDEKSKIVGNIFSEEARKRKADEILEEKGLVRT